MIFSVPGLPAFSLYVDELCHVFSLEALPGYRQVQELHLQPHMAELSRIDLHVFSTLAEAHAFLNGVQARDLSWATEYEQLALPWHGHGIAALIWWHSANLKKEDRGVHIHDRRDAWSECAQHALKDRTAHERMSVADRVTEPFRSQA